MRRRAFAALIVAAGSLAACSSSPGLPAATASANAQASTTSAVAAPSQDASSAAPSSSFPAGYAATGTAADTQGDTATVSVSIGAPVSLTSLGVTNVTACTDVGENLQYETDQWMATPVRIDVTLTSSLAVPVTVTLDGSEDIGMSGAEPNENLTSWAAPAQDDSGGSCQNEGIFWQSVTPNQAVSWSGWLMDPNAITANDPTGSSAHTEIFLMPVVELSSSQAVLKLDTTASHNLLDCLNVNPGPVIAVDVSLARSRGCTTYTGT